MYRLFSFVPYASTFLSRTSHDRCLPKCTLTLEFVILPTESKLDFNFSAYMMLIRVMSTSLRSHCGSDAILICMVPHWFVVNDSLFAMLILIGVMVYMLWKRSLFLEV